MSRGGHVLDASALLCLLFDEPGADRVERVLPDALISAANLAEVLSMLVDRGLDGDEALADLRELDLEVVALDRAQAEAAALLRSVKREAGLSLSDWACLALAQQRRCTDAYDGSAAGRGRQRDRRHGRVDPVSTFCESGRTVGQALSAEREPHGRRDRRAADVDVALVQMAVAVGTRLVLKPPAPSAPAVGSLRRHGESATSEGAMARRFGYSRVSTSDQDWSLQLEALTKAGVDDRDIFREKASGAKRDRTELRRMLDLLRPGDQATVYRLDRLARSQLHLLQIMEEIEGKGAKLVSLMDNIDTGTATRTMVVGVLAVLAEFERNLLIERCAAGVKNRAPTGRPVRQAPEAYRRKPRAARTYQPDLCGQAAGLWRTPHPR